MDGIAFLPRPQAWSGAQVRFMTAGSVDDGKSTLIGRLLLDAKALMSDQAAAIQESGELDLAALTDGLEAERAQGITIDVAYRYFATPQASFIIADAPGHEQYTRNMVTAASVSDVAVIVIDVSGVEAELKAQTRRHAAIAALMGLDMVVAANKMDLVDWSQTKFKKVKTEFDRVAETLGARPIAFVPLSAKRGDNVVTRGGAHWYDGPTLVEVLESIPARVSQADRPLRLPVQVVLRDGERRLYAGRIESGSVKPGDKVAVGPAAFPATVAQVRIGGLGVARANAGASVVVELNEDRDLGPGGVIADPSVRYTRRVIADLCWLDETSWVSGRRYVLRQGTLETLARIEHVRFIRDIATFGEVEKSAISLNDIANAEIAARDPLLADLYAELPGAGAFVLIDPDTNQTAAAGMIREIIE